MYADGFIYNDISLTALGYSIVNFGGSSGTETKSVGSDITFTTVSMEKGKRQVLTDVSFGDYLTTTFQIAKVRDVCDKTVYTKTNSISDIEISENDFKFLMRWLNSKVYNTLIFGYIDDDTNEFVASEDCCYNASFNIQRIMQDGMLVGLELTMITDSPFGRGVSKCTYGGSMTSDTILPIRDLSELIGYTYPTIEITNIKSTGYVSIVNERTSQTMTIKDCTVGEEITIDCKNKIVTSSKSDVYDRFNFEFICLSNDFSVEDLNIGFTPEDNTNLDNLNNFRLGDGSLECTITVSYYPIKYSSFLP